MRTPWSNGSRQRSTPFPRTRPRATAHWRGAPPLSSWPAYTAAPPPGSASPTVQRPLRRSSTKCWPTRSRGSPRGTCRRPTRRCIGRSATRAAPASSPAPSRLSTSLCGTSKHASPVSRWASCWAGVGSRCRSTAAVASPLTPRVARRANCGSGSRSGTSPASRSRSGRTGARRNTGTSNAWPGPGRASVTQSCTSTPTAPTAPSRPSASLRAWRTGESPGSRSRSPPTISPASRGSAAPSPRTWPRVSTDIRCPISGT